ncbi:heme-dependent oxidative N-demethylase subunit alpha family protein [Deinococcus altitudinis]|uniref:heme-dependent oxidative N-demethylase subunit alpha family protein n=1 Tax=Deinococcus altitudinis TaxID=468914 RepID=UPI0038917577
MSPAPSFSGVSPAVYRPYLSGRYSVSAGLYRLGAQPMEGRIETHTFAFDTTYPAYIAAKVAARNRALHEYYALKDLDTPLRKAALGFVARTAAHDSGGALTWDGQTLSNHLLGWAGRLDTLRGTLEDLRRFPATLAELVQDVQPLDALDFLAMNVQEDLSLLARKADGSDVLAALHVTLPEKWNPLEKVGRSFAEVHAPVAGSAAMIASAPKLIEAVVTRGPFARFVWGLTASGTLDHHPNLAPEAGLPTDPAGFFLRVERQTLHGFPAECGALFTIRAYVYPVSEHLCAPEQAAALAAGVRSMTPEQVEYKGLTQSRSALLDWLDGRARVIR